MQTLVSSVEMLNDASSSYNKTEDTAKRQSAQASTGHPPISTILPATPALLTAERRRLAVIPVSVFSAMIFELGMNIAFHTVTSLILADLRTNNRSKDTMPATFILQNGDYDEIKAHFWALFSNSLLLHLNSMTVVLWGIIPYGIAKGDASWLKAWTMLKKLLICLMLFNVTTLAFGGGFQFVTHYFIGFFSYFLASIVIIEIMIRYTPAATRILSD